MTEKFHLIEMIENCTKICKDAKCYDPDAGIVASVQNLAGRALVAEGENKGLKVRLAQTKQKGMKGITAMFKDNGLRLVEMHDQIGIVADEELQYVILVPSYEAAASWLRGVWTVLDGTIEKKTQVREGALAQLGLRAVAAEYVKKFPIPDRIQIATKLPNGDES